jgi:hypothetical protein
MSTRVYSKLYLTSNVAITSEFGPSETDEQWVECAGFYTGVFAKPWMGIRPTGHLLTMRFHEFFKIVDERIVEIQAVWDIPDWLRQANAWPMAPSLGCEIQVPGPATNNGIRFPFSKPCPTGDNTRQKPITILLRTVTLPL